MTKKLEEIIRVDHAGEFGAKVIYSGQIAALRLKGDKETLHLVEEMKRQEDVHYDYFDDLIKSQKVRPTVMQPVWRVGGFALGFVTAMISKKAAMTCTVAVEEVIDQHYQEQLNDLKGVEGSDSKVPVDLREKIIKFRDDELEHRDIGYKHDAKGFGCFGVASKVIKGMTRFAIGVSKRV